ncbi:hypothetical protein PG994_000871 [Apiospora phragmitis]|uniref:Metallo-beta-lactamase domain-containing protein n=1 Tax=Apiospora phragmitis TaxID=2905665 RepID=A0ABR1X7I9_9PEZI
MATNRSALLGAHLEKSEPSELRPILTSLNGDNSWLMSFPVPSGEGATRPNPRKAYYHIVWDPWFATSGVAVTIASWVASIARGIESKAARADLVDHADDPQELMVDAILISLHYTDHLHEPSLRQFDRRIPVIAAPEAAATMKGWDYFQTVVPMKDMGNDGSDWQALHPNGPLPTWLTPFRLRGKGELNFATALVWSRGFRGEAAEPVQPAHEALWVSPHGMRMDPPALQAFLRDVTKTVHVLAMLHPLKESSLWGRQTVHGVMGGLAVERALEGPKYWVRTADAVFSYSGLVMLRVRDVRRTLDWGLAEEERLAGEKGEAVVKRRPNLVQIDSGDSMVLE